MQKGFSVILILIGILVLGLVSGGAYYYGKPQTPQITPVSSPTPDASPAQTGAGGIVYTEASQSANWKTYTNTQIGFEMKYPTRYPKPNLPSGLGPTLYATGNEENTDIIFGETADDSVSLQVFPYAGTLEALKDYAKTPSLDGDSKQTFIKKVEVGGREALFYQATPPTVFPGEKTGRIRVYFTGNNHGFIFHTDLGHSEQELDQILSTFKFIQ